MTDDEALRRIAGYYLAGAAGDTDVVRVGPFSVVVHRSSDAWYLSYATVAERIGERGDLLAEVLAVFEERDRVPGFEWIAELAPDLADLLAGRGMGAVETEPLLVADRSALRPPRVEGSRVRVVGPDDDLAAVLHVSHTAMPELGEVTDDELARVASEIRRGQRVQVAVEVDGRVVAVGDHSPAGGVTEIAGVGTLPEFRRRGLAGLVTATLALEAFDSACDVVYLTAANASAARVYERVGFRRVATARTARRRPEGER